MFLTEQRPTATLSDVCRQIADEGFARELGLMLMRAGLPKDSLRLEVTESAVMAGAESAEAGLHALVSGTGVALDPGATLQLSSLKLSGNTVLTLDTDSSQVLTIRTSISAPGGILATGGAAVWPRSRSG